MTRVNTYINITDGENTTSFVLSLREDHYALLSSIAHTSKDIAEPGAPLLHVSTEPVAGLTYAYSTKDTE